VLIFITFIVLTIIGGVVAYLTAGPSPADQNLSAFKSQYLNGYSASWAQDRT